MLREWLTRKSSQKPDKNQNPTGVHKAAKPSSPNLSQNKNKLDQTTETPSAHKIVSVIAEVHHQGQAAKPTVSESKEPDKTTVTTKASVSSVTTALPKASTSSSKKTTDCELSSASSLAGVHQATKPFTSCPQVNVSPQPLQKKSKLSTTIQSNSNDTSDDASNDASDDASDAIIAITDEETSTAEETSSRPKKNSNKRKKPRKKKKRYRKRFNNAWLTIPAFKNWLEKGKHVTHKGEHTAFCKLCRVKLSAQKSVLLLHCKNKDHVKYAGLPDEKQKGDMEKLVQPSSSDLAVRRMELRFVALIAVGYLSFHFMDTFDPFLKKTILDSKNVQHMSMKRTKAGALMKNVLNKYFRKKLTRKLCRPGGFFSLILDECTDNSHRKQCGFSVIYYDEETDEVKESFFDLVDQSKGTAIELYNCLVRTLESNGVPLKNLVGFSADTTNVMVGSEESVFSHLKKNNPLIVLIKCSCHSAHLAASWACKMLPRRIEDLARNVGAHFHRSALRIDSFKEFQEFFGVAIHQILSPGQTRWLSLKACVDRLLEQLEPLKEYFKEVCREDPSATNDYILETLKYPFLKPYLEFLAYILEILTDFNVLFQANTSRLYLLKPEVLRLMTNVCKNYIKFNYLKTLKSVFDVSACDSSRFRPLNEIYVGPLAFHSLEELKNRGDPSININEFFVPIQNFYVELMVQLKKRFSFVFTDKLFDLFEMIEPQAAQTLQHNSLGPVFSRFPFLRDVVSETQVDNEWAQHALLDHASYRLDKTKSTRQYWKDVFALRNRAGEILFPNLKIVINFLEILPFSNASVERIFSTHKLIKTDPRNRLLSSTVAAICYVKEGVGNRKGVIDWEPPPELLKIKDYYHPKDDDNDDEFFPELSGEGLILIN